MLDLLWDRQIYIYIRITHLVWDRIVEIFPETRFLTSCAQAMYPTTILPTLEHASVLVFVSGHRFLDGSPTKRRGGTPSISCLRCDPRRRFSVGAIRSFEEINERNYFIKYFIVLMKINNNRGWILVILLMLLTFFFFFCFSLVRGGENGSGKLKICISKGGLDISCYSNNFSIDKDNFDESRRLTGKGNLKF